MAPPRASIAPTLGRNSVRSARMTPVAVKMLLTGSSAIAVHANPNAITWALRHVAMASTTDPTRVAIPSKWAGPRLPVTVSPGGPYSA